MIGGIILCLLLFKAAAQIILERLNRGEVLRHAGEVPEPFRQMIDEAGYRKSVDYTLAKNRLDQFSIIYHLAVLVVILFSGVLPWSYSLFQNSVPNNTWTMVFWLLAAAIVLGIPDLPLDWHTQFRLEERFGFNSSTQKTWWMDRLKGMILAVALGLPLLWFILKLVGWSGPYWWLWAWAAMVGFQLLLTVLAPILILPLFNKLTPLEPGSLRDRLLKLGERTGFHARNILVMDGSKRSRHSNAFFTGFGRFRKIVLFDTLIQQLTEEELEAVLAHEIGHYKKGHVPKLLAASIGGTFLAFMAIAWLANQPAFYAAFGFQSGSIVPALFLFSLLSGVLTFWLSPVSNLISRKFEYQADAFAAQIMGSSEPLVQALRKMNEKNASNLTPHPVYSGFYYSHPTLLERERGLASMQGPDDSLQPLARAAN